MMLEVHKRFCVNQDFGFEPKLYHNIFQTMWVLILLSICNFSISCQCHGPPQDHFRKIFWLGKRLSSLRSGDIFFRFEYNEGLKFRYSICRQKCFGPNETNFVEFRQNLWILVPFYEKKCIWYFHMGYTSAKGGLCRN